MLLSTNIRSRRRALDITQEELTEKIMVSPPMVSAYEHGFKIPNVCTLVAIADTLNVSVDWLLGRQGFANN